MLLSNFEQNHDFGKIIPLFNNQHSMNLSLNDSPCPFTGNP